MVDYQLPLDLFGEFIVVDDHPEIEVKRQRPNCPFYGFQLTKGVVIDNRSNGCVWLKQGYPCRMEMEGQSPCWDECSLNDRQTRKRIEVYASNTQIFPNEFGPKEGEWKGIRVDEWISYIKSLYSSRH